MRKLIVLALGCSLLASTCPAIDLKQSKFTQVVNKVEVISAADKSLHSAAVNDLFKMPDMLRTGLNSRAELVAADNTVTRVGANTIFSFDPGNRTIDLQQGSLLFHSPHGKGGGTIHTATATASVIGTTIIVTTTPNGGFKLLDLEGQAEVRFLNGLSQTLEPGRMIFVLPGGQVSPIVVFRLDAQTKGSALVGGFDKPLDSIGRINAAVTQQLEQILNNSATDTGLLVGNNATPDSVQVAGEIIPPTLTTPPPPPPPPVPVAFMTDAFVIGPDSVNPDLFSANYPPLDPNHLVTTPFTAIPSSLTPVFPFLNAEGFLGNNMEIDTASIDLSPFSTMGMTEFDFMAAGDMRIWQSLSFSGALPNSISLDAGGNLSIAQGAVLEAETGLFWLGAGTFNTLDSSDGSILYANTLDGVGIFNDTGDIGILTASDITLQDGSYILANGNAGLTSDGNVSILDSSYIQSESADVNISAGGTLTINTDGGTPITAGGSVDLEAMGDIDIFSSTLSANGGDMTIDACGILDIENGSDIEASGAVTLIADEDAQVYGTTINAQGGDMSLTSEGSTITVDGSTITASRNVTMEAEGGFLTVGGSSGDSITAGGSVTLTSDSDYVDIYNGTTVSANGGDVTVTAASDIDVESSSSITASGAVTLTANTGDVDIYDSTVTANDGSMSITADGVVDVEDASVIANGTVNIESGGNLLLGSSSSGATITSSGLMTLTSDTGDVDIDDGSQITANNVGGDVTITSGGSINMDSSSITASGSVTLDASEDGDVDVEGANISSGGDITIESSGSASIGLSIASTLTAGGAISITSDDDDVYIHNGTTIKANGGDLTITAANEVEIEDGSDLESSGSVSVTANDDDVSISDSTLKATGGSVGIQSFDGDVNLDNVTINASVDANIESSGTLMLGSSSSGHESSIIAGGSAYLTSDTGDVDIDNGTSVKANGGITDIEADGIVSINNGSDIEASGNVLLNANNYGSDIGGDVDVTGSTVKSSGGDVDIDSFGGTVDIENGSDIEATTGSINLNSTASDVDVNGTIVVAGDSATFSAPNGSVNLTGGSVNVLNNLNLSAKNNVIVTGTAITADPSVGNVQMMTAPGNSGSITIDGNATIHTAYLTLNSGDGILIGDASGSGTFSGNTASFTAKNTANIENADFTGLSTINITAHTIDLRNVAFNGTGVVNLTSFFGVANFGSTINGDVNFISGVTFGGKTIIADLLIPILGQINLSGTLIHINHL